MPLEALIDACVACAESPPSPAPTIIGSSSSPSTGPGPDNRDRDRSESRDNRSPSDRPHPRGEPDREFGPDDHPGDSRSDDKPSLLDRLFGGDSGTDIGNCSDRDGTLSTMVP